MVEARRGRFSSQACTKTHESDDVASDLCIVGPERVGHLDDDSKLFLNLPHEGFCVRLAWLNLAPGELPLPTGRFLGAAPASEHQTVMLDHGSNDFDHSTLSHKCLREHANSSHVAARSGSALVPAAGA